MSLSYSSLQEEHLKSIEVLIMNIFEEFRSSKTVMGHSSKFYYWVVSRVKEFELKL